MKIRVFVPSNEEFIQHRLESEVVPSVGAEFRFQDNLTAGFAVEKVSYLAENGMIVPQIWLTETGLEDIAEPISSWTSKF